MTQSLQLGGSAGNGLADNGMRRLNRLPIVIVIGLVILFFAVIIYGLSSRGWYSRRDAGIDAASNSPASTYADQLKKGISDGVIAEPAEAKVFQPGPQPTEIASPNVTRPAVIQQLDLPRQPNLEPEADWIARLEREQDEQYLREEHRQQMARLQARHAALDAPLSIELGRAGTMGSSVDQSSTGRRASEGLGAVTTAATRQTASDLYAAALRGGMAGQSGDANAQAAKEAFFNHDIKDLGYLPNSLVNPISPFELKRGSVIPAILITGISSDLPGRITAQVSLDVFDSATGHRLLIPQGAKLFGRYDSNVSFGQSRVLVVWTDVIFPNGSTLQIGGMAGTDTEGYGGFTDKVNAHYFRTFGSAALLAVIGTGIDMAIPESSTLATQDTASDAARRNFAETFGRVVEKTISKNLDVQPTITIRPGYRFNILVDQDIVFPGEYREA